MLFTQQWKNKTFESKYLSYIKNKITLKPELNLYLGFDYGFFCGINIYYGNEKGKKYAAAINQKFKDNKIKVRLMTNIETNFDVIILLGYSSIKKERLKLILYRKKIVKLLSFF